MFPSRFQVQCESLQKVESEQNEFIEQFILQKWVLSDIQGKFQSHCYDILLTVTTSCFIDQCYAHGMEGKEGEGCYERRI